MITQHSSAQGLGGKGLPAANLFIYFFMNDPVIGQQEELKVAEWDMTQLRWDFVCLIHSLDLVFFKEFVNMPSKGTVCSRG